MGDPFESPCLNHGVHSNVADFVDGFEECWFAKSTIRTFTVASLGSNLLGFASLLIWFLNLRRAGQCVRLDVTMFVVQAANSLVMTTVVLVKSIFEYEGTLIGKSAVMTFLWFMGSFVMFVSVDTIMDRYFKYIANVSSFGNQGQSHVPSKSNGQSDKSRTGFRFIGVTMSVTVLFALEPNVDNLVVFKVHMAQALFLVIFVSNVVVPKLVTQVLEDLQAVFSAYKEGNFFIRLKLEHRIAYLRTFRTATRLTGIIFTVAICFLGIYTGSLEKMIPFYIISSSFIPPAMCTIISYCFWPLRLAAIKQRSIQTFTTGSKISPCD